MTRHRLILGTSLIGWAATAATELAAALGLIRAFPDSTIILAASACLALTGTDLTLRIHAALIGVRHDLAAVIDDSVEPVRSALLHGYELHGEHCRRGCPHMASAGVSSPPAGPPKAKHQPQHRAPRTPNPRPRP